MRLGEILVLRGMVSVADIAKTLERQRNHGGKLGENLVALGLVSGEALLDVLDNTPAMPRTVAETGIARGNLLNLLMKFIRFESCELATDLGKRMKLQHSVMQELLDSAVAQKLLYVLGTATVGLTQVQRYALTDQGKADATAALTQSQYLGPAPVSLTAYQAQILRQAINNERLDFEDVQRRVTNLVLSDRHLRQLLPAATSGQTVLLYGPPGNGKTSVGLLMAGLFQQSISVPYALEVDGQIIKIVDESLHKPFIENVTTTLAALDALPAGGTLQTEGFDSRWMICRRPVAMAGGELTLDMLELRYDGEAKTYDAPLHLKALNGIFLIDDFGRQQVAPTDLLNRWIIPLESRVDYLKLKTGKSFSIPFDELVIFSTNLAPADLMDPAFLRRIPYKIHMTGPGRDEYREVFNRVAQARGLCISDEVFDLIVQHITGGAKQDLAYFQPKFICDQAKQVCRCFNLPPVITKALAEDALANLYVEKD